MFNNNQSVLYTYPASKNGKTYTVPSTVKQIADGAFAQTGGQNAHEGMTSKEKKEYNLTKVVVPAGVESIGNNAFLFSGITSIDLPYTLKSIGSSCFYYTDLTKITIPEGITRLENSTFGACASLESVVLPSTLKYIGKGNFLLFITLHSPIFLFYATEVPECDADAFSTFDNSVTLHVMGNAKQKYEDDSVFGSGIFDSIVGDLTPTNVTNAQQKCYKCS